MEQARAQYEEAIRAQPDYAMAHYNLATTLTALARLGEAEAEFNKVLRLTPENSRRRTMALGSSCCRPDASPTQ